NLLGLLRYTERVTGSEEAAAIVDHVSGGIGDKRGHWYELRYFLMRWEYIFNTNQQWSLFSPGVGGWFRFPQLEMRWDDRPPGAPPAPGTRAPIVLRGLKEPDDLKDFVRWGPWRFQRYEDYFVALSLRIEEGETTEDLPTLAASTVALLACPSGHGP